jgi:cytoskeletal protein CcmA (bactofilin family)
MKKLIISAFLIFLIPLVAFGAVLGSGEEYSLNKNEQVSENFYVAGGNVTIAGDVDADLLVAGGNIHVSGNVSEDVFIAGGSINLIGAVGSDVRIGGGNIVITGTIGGDVLVAGGQVHLVSGATVAGDVIIAGGNVTLNGNVLGDVKGAIGRVSINGSVGGDVNLIANEVHIGEGATLAKNLTYKAREEAFIDDTATIGGEVEFTQSPVKAFSKNRNKGILFGLLSIWTALKFFVLFITSLLLVTLFHTSSKQLINQTHDAFWKRLVAGFVVLVVLPVLMIMLFVTVLGSYIALLILVTYIFFLLLASLYGTILLGSVIERKLLKQNHVNWLTALIGMIAGTILAFVPFIGWMIMFAFFLAGLGGISHLWHKHLWLNK